MDYLQRSHISKIRFINQTKGMYDNFLNPLKHVYSYDIVVEKQSRFFTVKIVCTKHKNKSGNYEANLRKSGPRGEQEHFSGKSDYLYIDCEEKSYLIPCKKIVNTRSLTLTSEYDIFILSPHSSAGQSI